VARCHRVDAAEIFHWYGGAPLLLEIKNGEARHEYLLGSDWLKGEHPHASGSLPMPGRARTASAPGCWSAARSRRASSFQASRWRQKAGSPEPQSMNWPPLIVTVERVIQPASSGARTTAQRATSSTSPSRPTGICPTIDFITSSETPASRSVAT